MDDSLIVAWHSKQYDDVIIFHRVIAVNGSQPNGLDVLMEGSCVITVHPEEEKDFLESFETYLHSVQVLELQHIMDDESPSTPNRKR